ncbi:adenylate/guanylate cyclase domain-containing protein [Telmatospirillum sp. J64-1]|uniref:adenylate/guanylate cyclase domain-containing protein n=1 Tax=Telmatospirillum sp. J64-1 TaxID=2502183 RepID=UPI00115C55E7|nr:adenylate/guanylate cyclase domain-containing protein [Telmatospirillum sp. J64-1]
MSADNRSLPLIDAPLDRRQTTELLLDVSNRMAVSANLSEALQTLRRIAVSTLDSERGSIFLNDPATKELFSRIDDGKFSREIRLLNHTGVAGHVFTTGEGCVIHDAYADPRFNSEIDAMTGFTTRTILCAPLRTLRGDIIGVAQLLNKNDGNFTEDDLELLQAMIRQAAIVLESHRTVETIEHARQQELEFLSVVSEISTELKLGPMLQKIISAITRMLNAERSTLFINDEKSGELYTEVGQGLGTSQIRMPNHLGIAGAVFTTGESINIPHAYADLRFNPAFDRKTGFFTRSILCVPVINKNGKRIGVTQVLNKRGGAFTAEDEARLKAFTSQISIGLENAKLFEDVQAIKTYNEGILESMTNGVVTLDAEGQIVTCNAAALRILRCEPDAILKQTATEYFSGPNAWLGEKLEHVRESQGVDVLMDAQLVCADGEQRSVNVTVQPLRAAGEAKPGSMVVIEDISNEKRMKSTMARYMDPTLADKLLGTGEDILGGQSSMATILFSDVRSFTTLTEELGAQGTVSLLNEYFTIMVDCIQNQGGMLDKFIGDAIMAVFGTPLAHDDDEDRAVRAAISMLRELDRWNAQRLAQGRKPVEMGIGLNTDMVVSGNIGSPKRMDYTVIGDGVNLAARLESACKEYGARLLVSEYTVCKLRGTYRLREVDKVVVKGKTQPVGVFEVLDYHNDATFPNMMEALSAFSFGLKAYRDGRFGAALKAFEEALTLHPGDAAAAMYVKRCSLLQREPPGDGWDGVWVMKSK